MKLYILGSNFTYNIAIWTATMNWCIICWICKSLLNCTNCSFDSKKFYFSHYTASQIYTNTLQTYSFSYLRLHIQTEIIQYL